MQMTSFLQDAPVLHLSIGTSLCHMQHVVPAEPHLHRSTCRPELMHLAALFPKTTPSHIVMLACLKAATGLNGTSCL